MASRKVSIFQLFPSVCITLYSVHVSGYVGTRDYVGSLQFSWKTQHRSTHPTEKQDSDPLVASSVHRTPAQNSQREGLNLQREDRSPIFQWDVWIGLGPPAVTAGSLRKPETRRTPSCSITVHCTVYMVQQQQNHDVNATKMLFCA